MIRSAVFTSNRSQAVRLSKPVAFPAEVHEVEIKGRPQPAHHPGR
jgi:antitoxin VapB